MWAAREEGTEVVVENGPLPVPGEAVRGGATRRGSRGSPRGRDGAAERLEDPQETPAVGERREGAGARRSGTGEAPGRDRMSVGSPPPAGRSLDQAAWGSPARCGRSGFPVAVGPAVGAHGGDGGPECQWPLNIAPIAGDPVAVAAATATGSPAAGSGPFMPPSFRLRIPVR